MDLRSAAGGAGWHPLTSLITFESAAKERELWLVPLWEPPRRDNLRDYSTALHEAAHMWSCKNTRLGWVAGIMASQSYADWRADRSAPLALPLRFTRLLGAMMPLLEGVAMYAQLDYETMRDGDPLPSPLAIEIRLFEVAVKTNHRSDKLFRLLREYELFAAPDAVAEEERDGWPALLTLPELLFLETSDDSTLHYFHGYLYVKAIAAWIGRSSALARDPAWFLPLAIKLLFDHPIIERAFLEDLSPREILQAIHASITDITPEQWTSLDALLSDPRNRTLYDHWDPHQQFAQNAFARLLLHGADAGEQLLGANYSEELAEGTRTFRASAAVHFLGWKHGVLRNVLMNDGQSGGRFTLETDEGAIESWFVRSALGWIDPWADAVESIQAGSPSDFARSIMANIDDLDADDPAEQIRGRLAAAIQFEERFLHWLQRSEGQRVTVASFVSLSGGTHGVALWAEGELVAWFSHDPDPFVFSLMPPYSEIDYVTRGLKIDPMERESFARAFVDASEVWQACGEGRDMLIEQLIADPEARWSLRRRFGSTLFKEVQPEVRVWCRANPLRQEPNAPPASLLAIGDRVFDFPGFQMPRGGGRLSLRDCLPVFPPS